MKFPFLLKSAAAVPKTTHSPDDAELCIKGLRPSERFFFEPGRTNSILEEAKSRNKRAAAVLEIDSADPFLDFRASMEEMAEAHALKDWGDLENLLSCYLRLNGENNHGYIIGAFVDLVFHLALERGPDDFSYSFSSGGGSYAASFLSTAPCSSRV